MGEGEHACDSMGEGEHACDTMGKGEHACDTMGEGEHACETMGKGNMRAWFGEGKGPKVRLSFEWKNYIKWILKKYYTMG
jgi:hypothetical protein